MIISVLTHQQELHASFPVPTALVCSRDTLRRVMPVLAMTEDQSVVDHQKRFQAAVDVIHNLPKNGSYRPSYEVMLRFYSLYKQAVCGPCTVSRPGFWDPVGRYKWDAWRRLGEMSSESAMAAYVEEMKKVAQEVIDTMPMNEKTASLFHYFEPLYVVIDDMPRPPQSLISLREDVKDNGQVSTPAAEEEKEEELKEEEVMVAGREEAGEEPLPSAELPLEQEEVNLAETLDLSTSTAHQDSGLSEGLVLTSDSESEIFCDSVDSVEQLDSIKVDAQKRNSLQNGHVHSEPLPIRSQEAEAVPEATQVGAGQGGEGAGDAKGPPMRRGREAGRDGMHHGWRERGPPQGGARRPTREAPEAGGGAGQGGGDGSDGGGGRLHDVQVQQQIVLALRRLREDMRSVMERLEVVERLAAAHAESADWRPCPVCTATASEQEEKWWPFNVSGQTTILLLLWPFVAQGLVFLLRKGRRK